MTIRVPTCFRAVTRILFFLVSSMALLSLSLPLIADSNAEKIAGETEQFIQEIEQLPSGREALLLEQEDIGALLSRNISLLKKELGALESLVQSEKLQRNNNSHWQAISKQKELVNRLSLSKANLLKLSQNEVREKYTAYGRDAVQLVKLEAKIIKIESLIWLNREIRLFSNFSDTIGKVLIGLIISILKLIAAAYILTLWLRNVPRFFHLSSQRELDDNWRTIKKLSPYLEKIAAPLGWFLFLSLLISLLQDLMLLDAIKYAQPAVTGFIIAIASYRLCSTWLDIHGNDDQDARKQLNKQSLFMLIRITALTYVVLETISFSLYEGAIYYWSQQLMIVFIFIEIIRVIRLWRPFVFEGASNLPTVPSYVAWSLTQKEHLLISPIASVLCMIHLSILRAQTILFTHLSKYDFFKQIIAYFFSIEVIKQTIEERQKHNLAKMNQEETFKFVLPGQADSYLIESYGEQQLDDLCSHVLKPVPAMTVVTCERGCGMTTFLRRLVVRSSNKQTLYIDCPHGGLTELMKQLSLEIGLGKDSSEGEFVQALRKAESRYLFCIDNSQRLVSPKVNGISSLIKFINIIRRGRGNHGVVLGLEQSAWRFVERARGERLILDRMLRLPRWTEEQLTELMKSRINTDEQYAIHFDDLKIPKQWDDQELDEVEKAQNGFFRILWNYSDGNPSVALRFFRMSLFKDIEKKRVVARIFKAPEDKGLELLPKPMLAVLRAIVQLELASAEELSECTQLSYIEVLNTLRFFQNRGFITMIDDKAKISDHWYRFVTNTLHNQHLLVK